MAARLAQYGTGVRMDGRRHMVGRSVTERATPDIRRPSEPVAHTPRPGTDEWDLLNQHLIRVSNLAGHFANEFGARDLGRLLGLWHDLGKHNPAWQDYLWACYLASVGFRSAPSTKVPHAIWGAGFAYWLMERLAPGRWHELALPILGHHTGLKDAGTASSELDDFLHNNQIGMQVMQTEVKSLQAALPGGLPAARFPTMELTQRELFFGCFSLLSSTRIGSTRHPTVSTRALRAKSVGDSTRSGHISAANLHGGANNRPRFSESGTRCTMLV